MPSYALETDVILYANYASETDVVLSLGRNEEDESVSVRAHRVDGSGDSEIVRIRQDGTLQRVGNLATELGFATNEDGFIKVNN